jgi:hypothetical protein
MKILFKIKSMKLLNYIYIYIYIYNLKHRVLRQTMSSFFMSSSSRSHMPSSSDNSEQD